MAKTQTQTAEKTEVKKTKKTFRNPKFSTESNSPNPMKDSFVHIKSSCFEKTYTTAGLHGFFKSQFEAALDDVARQIESQNSGVSTSRFTPEQKKQFLTYFSENGPYTKTLLQFKEIMVRIRDAISRGFDSGRTSNQTFSTKDISSSKSFKSAEGMIETTIQEDLTSQEMDDLIAQIVKSVNSAPLDESGKKVEGRVMATKLMASNPALKAHIQNTLLVALQKMVTQWSENCKEYRPGTLKSLQEIQTAEDLIKNIYRLSSDLGFLMEVMVATDKKARVAGDEDNKNTTTDIEHKIDGIDTTIGESIKLYRRDTYKKEYDITFADLEQQFGGKFTELINPLKYFLVNYAIGTSTLGYPKDDGVNIENSMKATVEVINKYLKTMGFIAALLKGNALHSDIANMKANLFPMIFTINGKSMFTEDLWIALKELLNNPESTSETISVNGGLHMRQQGLGDSFKKLVDARAQWEIDNNFEGPLPPAVEQLGSEVREAQAGVVHAVFGDNYKEHSIGKVSVAITIAKLLNQ